VSWTVANQGTHDAEGTWIEAIYLSNDAVVGGDTLVAWFEYSGPMAPGDPPVERTETFTLPAGLPEGDLHFIVVVDHGHDVIELGETNNAAVSAETTLVPARLTVSLSATQAPEDAGPGAIQGTVTRSGNLSSALVVDLSSSDETEATVPLTVTIPAGWASATFDVDILTDGVHDGIQSVAIEASADDMVPGVAGFMVLDIDAPTLTLDLAYDEVDEGDTWTATVTRSVVTDLPLSVLLWTSPGGVLDVPQAVEIPADQASVTFDVTAVDDDLVKLTLNVTVEAEAGGFESGTDTVAVADNDSPTLTLTLDRAIVSEAAGQQVVAATVTRDLVSSNPLTVLLHSNDPSELSVPASVVIPAGAASVVVYLDAVDDAAIDGTQTVQVTATPTCYLGYPLASGDDTATIDVTDDDGPTLTVSFERDLLGEGLTGATNVTVTRNTDTTGPLTVDLVSSDTNELLVPTSVVIPAGEASYTFPVDTYDDGVPDGPKTVSLVATSAGFAPGSDTVVVTDESLPDLVVSRLDVPATVLTDELFYVTYEIANQGLAEAIATNADDPFPGSWQQRVFLSDDPFAGGDTLLGTFEYVGTLPETGMNYFARTLPFHAPRESGQYWIVVTTDLGDTVVEGIETNNTRVAGPIQIDAAYTATVQTDTVQALTGTPVVLYGTATMAGTSQPAAYSLVNLHLEVRGTKRIISALTNALGQFSTTFTPLPGEAGHYTVGAAHPGETTAAVQDDFILLGMKATPPSATLSVIEGDTATGQFTLRNLADVALTGLNYTLLDVPANLNVSVELPTTTLGPLDDFLVDFEVEALDASVPTATLTIRLTSAEGVTVDVPVEVNVVSLQPVLEADTEELLAAMLRGEQRFVEFHVTNTGGVETGPINVALPSVSWLSLSTPSPMPSLAPGQSAAVVLTLSPEAALPLTVYEGNLVLSYNNTALSMPFTFRAVSEAQGDLLITAIDELYYFTAEAPTLAGATVALLDPVSGEEVARGTTDVDGNLLLPDLQEGYYTLEVRAEDHGDCTKMVFVAAEQTTPILAFLTQQTVKYIWSVEETEIQDRTRITVETVFETNVPTPVVTVDPPVLDLAELTAPGMSMQVDMTLTNHGLIAAQNVQFFFDDHLLYKITPLINDVGTLPAKSSLTVPILVERVALEAAGTGDGGAACSIGGGVSHEYECGPETVKKGTQIPVINADVPGCVSAEGGPGGPITITPVHFPATEFTPWDWEGEWECDCVEKDLFEVDLSGWFEPAVAAAEAAINAAIAASMVSVDLEVEAKGRLKTCCKYNPETQRDEMGLEFAANAKVTGTAAVGPGISQGVSISEPLPDGGSVAFSGSVFAGLQVSLSVSLSGQVSSGCDFENPNASLTGTVRVGLDAGIRGNIEAKKDGGVLPGSVELAGVTGGLFGSVAVIVNYSTDTGLQICLASEGLYFEVAASAFGVTVSPFDDPSTTEVETKKYLIEPASTCTEGAPMEGAGVYGSFEELQAALAAEMAKLGMLVAPPAPVEGAGTDCGCPTDEPAEGQGTGVCAHVRLNIDQEAVMTRSAFDAGLELINDAEVPLENIQVSIQIVDQARNDVTDRFGVHDPMLTNLSGVDGSGTVLPGASGKASWLIVPTDEAAPDGPAVYGFGGTLSYDQDGRHVIVPLEPVWLTVYPDAALDLKYFHQRDVFSDDPHTTPVEPAVPYALAVMVQNNGVGTARDLSITSAQPEIVENEKGLLVDFEIIATQVAGQNMTPSLTADFGDVGPGETEIATWLMTSSLQGQFIEYDATFEHLDGLGDPRLSLIKNVEIHELVHLVQADRGDEDGLPDFLVNDVADMFQTPDADYFFYDLPDTLHLSDGRVEPVSLMPEGTPDGTVTPGDLVVELTVDMTEGWNYLRMPDPGGGDYALVGVQRADASAVPTDNFWQTDRTFI
ncbi:MAG: hypothetical protein JW818_23310, partial [Pirellulales bacterium]|nr:hypothetical protein [Pirellulales bacterium]